MTTNDRYARHGRLILDRAVAALALGRVDGGLVLRLFAQNGVLHIPQATHDGAGWEAVWPDPLLIPEPVPMEAVIAVYLFSQTCDRLTKPGYYGRAEITVAGRKGRLQKPKAEVIEELHSIAE